eukprot:gene2705-16140_t
MGGNGSKPRVAKPIGSQVAGKKKKPSGGGGGGGGKGKGSAKGGGGGSKGGPKKQSSKKKGQGPGPLQQDVPSPRAVSIFKQDAANVPGLAAVEMSASDKASAFMF